MEDAHTNEVTFVISRNIKSGYGKEYDDWLRRYLAMKVAVIQREKIVHELRMQYEIPIIIESVYN